MPNLFVRCSDGFLESISEYAARLEMSRSCAVRQLVNYALRQIAAANEPPIAPMRVGSTDPAAPKPRKR